MHAGLPAPFSEGDRGVLHSMIRVMHDFSGPPLPEGHVDGPQMRGPATPGIQNDREKEEPRPDAM